MKSAWRLLICGLAAIFVTGCIAGVQLLLPSSEEDNLNHAGKYEELIRVYERRYPEALRQKAFLEARAQVTGGDLSGIPAYVKFSIFHRLFAAALIETRQFRRARVELDRALQETHALLDARARVRSPHSASLQQENLILLQWYKGYLDWLETGSRSGLANTLTDQALSMLPPARRIPKLIQRAFAADKLLGDYRQALNYLDRALALAQQLDVRDLDVKFAYSLQAYRRKAWIQMRLGRLAEANVTLQQYEEMARSPSFRAGKAILRQTQYFRGYLSMMDSTAGAVHAASRDFVAAQRYFDMAMESLKDIPSNPQHMWDRNAVAAYHILYGTYFLGLQKRYPEALQAVEEGLPYIRPEYIDALYNEIDIESAYLYAAELHSRVDENGLAKKRALEARTYAQRYHSAPATAAADTILGAMLVQQGKALEGLQHLERATVALQQVESSENWRVHYWKGTAYARINRRDTALREYRRAVDEVEKLWDGRFDDVVRQLTFMDERFVAYEAAIESLIASRNFDEAFAVTEKSKARTAYETRLAETNEHSRTNSALKPSDRQENRPMTYAQIRQILPVDTVLLEYYVGTRSVFGFVVTSTGTIAAQALDISPQDLWKKISEYRNAIRIGYEDQYVKPGRELFAILVKPFGAWMVGKRNLGIVPHGPLHYLPFHALVLDDEPASSRMVTPREVHGAPSSGTIRPADFQHLIDRHAVFYGPSATLIAKSKAREQAGRSSLLALGSPPSTTAEDLGVRGELKKLPAAADEARSVAKLYANAKLLTDDDASESNAKRHLVTYDNLLFSAHAVFSLETPLRSAILFAPDRDNDGRLTIPEIESLSLKASLVVLSACQTGEVTGYNGAPTPVFPLGDDLVSMQRAFLRAGASSVISSLWEVYDMSAKELIERFFRYYKSGKSRAEALRAAQQDLLTHPSGVRWKHPKHWAPFIIAGDWR